mgnify:CR=1 FL=1
MRLREIEEALFGSDELVPQAKDSQVTLVRTISELDQKLKSLTFGKEKFNHCYAELRKLEKWIGAEESSFHSLETASDNSHMSKFEEVLAFEDEIKDDAYTLEKIAALEPSLDKAPIREVPALQPALDSLKLDLIRTKKDALDLEDECQTTIARTLVWFQVSTSCFIVPFNHYFTLLQDLAAKLAVLNADLTALEKKKEDAKYE